jgi:hypothetical protein
MKLFARELRALRQSEGHWREASDAWKDGEEQKARAHECMGRSVDSKAARFRSMQEFINWEEDNTYNIRDLEAIKDWDEYEDE